MAIAFTNGKGTAPGGFTPQTLFGERKEKWKEIEIGEEGEGSRGNLRERKE